MQPMGTRTQTVRFNLKPHLPNKDLRFIPKQYDLTKQAKSDLKNTFVFSEKNLPGFKPKSMQGGRSQDILRSIDSSEGPVKVTRRGPRTIPKRTEYVASIEAEYVCTPRDNAEFRRINWEKQHAKDSARTSFVATEKDAQSLHKQGMKISTGDEDFINTGAPKRRPQDNKATRMPRPALIDALQKMFKQYKFWPMSALKQELEQPEAWLKEVLSEIAVLVKTGRAANHYMLRPENQLLDEISELDHAVKAEDLAPDVKGEDDDGDQELEFEDA
jgi:transcription initiation factor TFIIF subunit beta